jgi:site-specific DNA-methyltransferase (adenine-specific)
MSEHYYQDETVTLYQGDALDTMSRLPDHSVSMMVLDPPYSMVPNSVRGRDDGAAGTSGAPVRLLSETFTHARRLLTPGGIAAIVCDWRRFPDVAYLVGNSGLRLATCVAWTRTTVGTGGLFRGAWDPVLIASSGTANAIDRAAIPNVIQANPPGRRSHPYEKPEALWAHIMQRIPSGVVLDPFAGSGASLRPAVDHGSTWVGIEVDQSHCELIVSRASSTSGKDGK